MNNAKSIFEKYLTDTELLKLEQLGSKKVTAVTQKDSDVFKENLTKQLQFNNTIVLIAVILLCVIFLTGIFFVFYYRDNPTAIGVFFGGSFLSLLTVVAKLRKIWLEKSLMDISLGVVDGLSPTEAAKFIQTIYYSSLQNDKKK